MPNDLPHTQPNANVLPQTNANAKKAVIQSDNATTLKKTGNNTQQPTMDEQDGLFPAVLPLSTLDGDNGFRIDGVTADDLSGYSVSAAGRHQWRWGR